MFIGFLFLTSENDTIVGLFRSRSATRISASLLYQSLETVGFRSGVPYLLARLVVYFRQETSYGTAIGRLPFLLFRSPSLLRPLGALAFPLASLGTEFFRIKLIQGDVLIRIGVNFNSFLYPKQR
jgi:hypothetical protein